MMYWWSDKFLVAKKFRNGNGAKELTRRPLEGDMLYPSCPECGSVMMPSEGCYTYPSWGYSK